MLLCILVLSMQSCVDAHPSTESPGGPADPAVARPQLNTAIEELNQKSRRPLSRKVLQCIAAADPATNAAVQELQIPGFSKRAREQYGAAQ